MILRRSLLVALAFLVLATGGYAVYWWIAAAQAESAIDRWIQDWRRGGYTVETAARTLGGFPGVVTLDLDAVRLIDPEGVWAWESDRLRFEVRPWAPTDYRVELFGTSRLTAPIDGTPRRIDLAAERAVGGAEIDLNGALRRATLTLDALAIDSADLALDAAADRVVVTLDLPAAPPTGADDPSAELMLSADGVDLPPRHAGPLGDRVERLSTRMRVMGPVPQAGLRRALTLWRDAGGRLETPWLRVGWGPLGLDAEGQMTLDGELRPAGGYQARISGLDGAIERFREAGLIDPTAARLLVGGARLFARQGSDGRAYIEMPLTAENGGLYLGPIRVAQLPPVVPAPRDPTAPPPVAPAPPAGAVESEDLPEIQDPPTVGPDFPRDG
ncbi:MAG: DUF2125 domain-containing protein [Marivibrio sp.]|uniref:DUF2125 domain-containing protein n=1 Tax=Marivibrio sp. TaxID=2039719 RepID=UPI0032EC8AC1